MSEALLELYRHKTWATVRLIEACAKLDAEQLNASTPGTFGTIVDTLHHLVGAEEGYLALASGEEFDRLRNRRVGLDELAARIRAIGSRWETLARDPDAGSREVVTQDGWRTVAAIPMAQAIHHADDHRAHVMSILGANGIELDGIDIGEDLDVWHHGIDIGLMRPVDDAIPD
ncbi:MAG TPA: DinB family protein [Micromonosporaceae bacterium]|jgi:uncharacterized damage-inducible protein DinB